MDNKDKIKHIIRNEKYVNYVYMVNKEFIRLCGYDAIIDGVDGLQFLYSFLEDLFKIIFCSSNYNKKTVSISKIDGLLKYDDINVEFLKRHLEIIDKYNDLLYKLKFIRNKIEHNIDLIEFNQSSSGTLECFSFSLKVNECIYTIESTKLAALLKDINNMYSIIQNEDEKDSLETDFTLKERRLYIDDYSLLYDDLISLRKAVISII